MNVTDQSTIARDRKLLQVVLYTIFAAVPLLVAVVVVLSIWALQGRANDREQIAAIQQERVTNIRDACEQQNLRHDETIATLDKLLARRLEGASDETRAQAEQSRAATVLLIEALAPKRDCEQVVRAQTGASTGS
jgi:hypothetical protein